MTDYRRLYLQNHPVFITIVTHNRNPILIKNINLLRKCFKLAKTQYKFEIFASVILPDHIHLILNTQDDAKYSSIISLIKAQFSKNIDNLIIKPELTESKIKKREKGIWQRRFYEHTIRDEKDLHNHLDYIHYNSVKHGYSQAVKDWEYSSFQKFVKKHWYELEWGTKNDIKDLEYLKINEYD